MRKPFHRLCIAILLCIFCVGFFGTTVKAEARASYYLDYYDCWVTAGTNGKINVNTDISAKRTMSEIGVSQIYIMQSKDSGLTWKTVKSYKKAELHMYHTRSSGYSGSMTYQGTVGYQYKAVVTVYAKDASGSDTKTLTTNHVAAKR